MNLQEQRAIDFLNRGIDFKRRGMFNEALDEYRNAYSEYPYNKNIYGNSAKIYIVTGNIDSAMKNYLTYAHLIYATENLDMSQYDYAINFYDWSGSLNNRIKIYNDSALKIVSSDLNFAKIVTDLNLTFYAGFSYLVKYFREIDNVQIPAAYMNNTINSILGRPTNGPSLSETNLSPMIRAVGLAYLYRNMVPKNAKTPAEIVKIYFYDNFTVDNIM